MRVVAAFREVVAGPEPLLAPAEPARGLGREIVREREEHFGSKGLHESSPGLPRQRGLERTEALRGDDRYAFGLAGQAEELLVAGGLALSDRGEVLVFITEEKDLPEISFRLGFDLRNEIGRASCRARGYGLGGGGVVDRKSRRCLGRRQIDARS